MTRIDPTTVASKETEARTASVANQEMPARFRAAGGWVPPGWLPLAFGGVGGALTALLPFTHGPAQLAISIALGLLASVGSALGIKSAGPRKP